MFLIRTAFWLAVVVMFLPTSQSDEAAAPEAAPVAQISMWEAVGAARSTASDMAGFCGRNTDVCQTGEVAWQVFRSKAKYGAQMVYGWFAENAAPSPARERTLDASQPVANSPENPTARPPANPAILRNTLTSQDLAPAWQGRGAGKV